MARSKTDHDEKKLKRKAENAESLAGGDVKLSAKKGKKAKKEKRQEQEEEETPANDAVNPEDEEMLDAPAETEACLENSSKEKKNKLKKEKKEKKSTSKSGEATSPSSPAKKRKRGHELPEGELEIDVNLPEPPSKKALRKLKKAKSTDIAATDLTAASTKRKAVSTLEDSDAEDDLKVYPEHASQSRSKWGVWIGNLTFSTTVDDLRKFFAHDGSPITPTTVTRIHLPTDPKSKKNKGFAYVDFTTKENMNHAISLSESLLGGRRVLIKSSTDFSNRSASASADAPNAKGKLGANFSKKPPSKILFVGNLDFTVTEDDLKTHFAFAGNVVRVRLTTFQDTGKCKGFGFVDFEDIASVTRAMKGLTEDEEEKMAELEGKEEVELEKRRKRRGILGTRPMVMEYGEDRSTRYEKRFGKKRPHEDHGDADEQDEERPTVSRARDAASIMRGEKKQRLPRDHRASDPGAVYSSDVRRTGGITESKGKKISFDEA